MDQFYTNASVSISELKKNPAVVIEEAAGFPVVVLNDNQPAAYLVPVATFEAMMKKLEDFELANQVKARANERTVKVYPDAL